MSAGYRAAGLSVTSSGFEGADHLMTVRAAEPAATSAECRSGPDRWVVANCLKSFTSTPR
jgi:hypothetical protein